MGCRSCDLARIYKQFQEKARRKAQAAKEVEETPVVSVIDKSQPTKTKKKRASKKEVIEPVEEKTEERIEEIKEDVVTEPSFEEIIDAK